MSEVSMTSEESARVFAQKHGLSDSAEHELAELLESTWQDGIKAEQGFRFLDGLAKASTTKGE